MVGDNLCGDECIADANAVIHSMTAAQSALVDKSSAQNSDNQNVLAEISEPTEENLSSKLTAHFFHSRCTLSTIADPCDLTGN